MEKYQQLKTKTTTLRKEIQVLKGGVNIKDDDHSHSHEHSSESGSDDEDNQDQKEDGKDAA